MTTNAKFGTNCVKQSSVSLPFLEHEILFCVRVYRVFVWECIGCEYTHIYVHLGCGKCFEFGWLVL